MTSAAQKWRKRAAKNLPMLANRVFALRTAHYPGCGFHWSMERKLGSVIAVINDYDRPFGDYDQLGVELGLSELYRDVARAEAGV